MLRVPIKVLGLEFERSAHIRNLFVSYSETLLAQIQQTVACNALHTTPQKICRWLLMMHDRADSEDLAFTHEFLAGVLGVNRKSVTLAAQVLQKAGLIDYRRGKMQVLDRPGLEKASCECYAIVKKRFDDFLKPPSMRFRKIYTGGNSRDDGGSFALKSLAGSPEKCIGPAKPRFKIVFEHRRSLGTFDHD